MLYFKDFPETVVHTSINLRKGLRELDRHLAVISFKVVPAIRAYGLAGRKVGTNWKNSDSRKKEENIFSTWSSIRDSRIPSTCKSQSQAVGETVTPRGVWVCRLLGEKSSHSQPEHSA